jgi:hypothetical protein
MSLEDVSKLINEKLNKVLLEKGHENVEIEFRIGTIIPGEGFSTDITKSFYEKIKNKLDLSASKGIFNVNICNSEDTFINGVRKSVSDSGVIFIKKLKILTMDFKIIGNSPFDLRVSVSKEIPFPEQKGNYVYKRSKKRTTYVYKNWNYDITEITSEKNTLIDTSYEFELELRDTSIIDEKIVLSSLKKIKDIIDMTITKEEISDFHFELK